MHGENSYNPLVSVIIPNYNHASFLKERIDSVLNQSYNNFELIILDDCSTDNSQSIIENYRGHAKINHIEFNKTNSGSTFIQWKKGFDLAKGDWIWIAESDDVSDIHFLEQLLTESEVEIVYCNSKIIDSDSKPALLYGFTNMPSKESHPLFENNFNKAAMDFLNEWMLKDNFIPNASAVLFKKSLFNKVCSKSNIFEDMGKMKLVGDWYFWLNLLLRASAVSYKANSLNYFRQHSLNVRQSTMKNSFTELKFILKLLRENNMPMHKTIDTYLYRYFHRNKNTRFALSEKFQIWINAWRFGFLGLFIKNALKYR